MRRSSQRANVNKQRSYKELSDDSESQSVVVVVDDDDDDVVDVDFDAREIAKKNETSQATKKRKGKILTKKSKVEFDMLLLESCEKAAKKVEKTARERMKSKQKRESAKLKFLERAFSDGSSKKKKKERKRNGAKLSSSEDDDDEDSDGDGGNENDESETEPTAAMKRVKSVPEKSPGWKEERARKAKPKVIKDASDNEDEFLVTEDEQSSGLSSSNESSSFDDDDDDDDERKRWGKKKKKAKKEDQGYRKDDLKERELEKIEKILGSRKNVETNEIEYLCKWEYFSFRDLSWVGETEMKSIAKPKIDAYKRKFGFAPISEDPDNLHPKEYLEIDRICSTKEVEEYDTETGNLESSTYYLCKWRKLNYKDATWMPETDLTSVEDIAQIERFKLFSDPPLPNKKEVAREVARVIHNQKNNKREDGSFDVTIPEFKNGMCLRDYQESSFRWMVNNCYKKKNVILGDEMGLGKTAQTIAVMEYMRKYKHDYRPTFCVIAPLSTLMHWRREIEKWTDMNAVIYDGTAIDRQKCEEFEFWLDPTASVHDKETKFDVVLVSYENVLKFGSTVFKTFTFEVLVVDEGHRLKNIESATAKAILALNYDWLLMLTGTPIQNNVKDLFGLMHVLAPKEYPNWYAFCDLFSIDPLFQNDPTAEQVMQIRDALKPRLLRRLKDDVEKIPAKEEIILWVELTPLQRTYYKAVYEKKVDVLLQGAKSKNTPQLRNICMELRKVCNHPFLCDGLEDDYEHKRRMALKENQKMPTPFELLRQSSGKMGITAKLLQWLRESGHKVLIFSQFKRVLDILQDFLGCLDYPVERLDGDTPVQQRQEGIDRFNSPDSGSFAFLLSTRAGGVGITLTAADTAIIFDSDWNPQNDLQAMARCHRIGQTKEVKVYRLITKNTYEEHLFKTASKKAGLDEAILGGTDDLDDDDGENNDNDDGDSDMNDGDDEKQTKKKKTKKENEAQRITLLLKKGLQFTHADEEKADEESKKFENEDIMTIIKNRASVKSIGNKAGNAFAMFKFKEDDEEDFEDPGDDWVANIFPEAAKKAEEEKLNRSWIDDRFLAEGKRKRVVIGSYQEDGVEKQQRRKDERENSSRDRCWSRQDVKTMYNAIFTYGCPHGDIRRVLLSPEVLEEIRGRPFMEKQEMCRSLLGIIDVIYSWNADLTAQTIITNGLSSGQIPDNFPSNAETLIHELKTACWKRRERLKEREMLANLYEKERTDEDYGEIDSSKLPTLKDVFVLKDHDSWYGEEDFVVSKFVIEWWKSEHDDALLRGSLRFGYSPWNANKYSEQLEQIQQHYPIFSSTENKKSGEGDDDDNTINNNNDNNDGGVPNFENSDDDDYNEDGELDEETFKMIARARLVVLLGRLIGVLKKPPPKPKPILMIPPPTVVEHINGVQSQALMMMTMQQQQQQQQNPSSISVNNNAMLSSSDWQNHHFLNKNGQQLHRAQEGPQQIIYKGEIIYKEQNKAFFRVQKIQTKNGLWKIVWTDVLHKRFVDAFTQLEELNQRITATTILKEMDLSDFLEKEILTATHVSSHLQTYRQQNEPMQNNFPKQEKDYLLVKNNEGNQQQQQRQQLQFPVYPAINVRQKPQQQTQEQARVHECYRQQLLLKQQQMQQIAQQKVPVSLNPEKVAYPDLMNLPELYLYKRNLRDRLTVLYRERQEELTRMELRHESQKNAIMARIGKEKGEHIYANGGDQISAEMRARINHSYEGRVQQCIQELEAERQQHVRKIESELEQFQLKLSQLENIIERKEKEEQKTKDVDNNNQRKNEELNEYERKLEEEMLLEEDDDEGEEEDDDDDDFEMVETPVEEKKEKENAGVERREANEIDSD